MVGRRMANPPPTDGAEALDRRELQVHVNLSLRLILLLFCEPFQAKVTAMKKIFLKKIFFALSIIFAFASLALAQESGNSVYGGGQKRHTPNVNLGNLYSSESKDAVSSPFVEAYVLMNVKADEYVAIFGLAQEGPTTADSNGKVDAQLKTFTAALEPLGIKSTDIFVDFITQNRVYDFAVAGSTAKEKLTGFETKKNIAVRYRDRTLLEKILAAAAKTSIFDLIKVDYVVSDMNSVRQRLLEEASKVIKKKEENYARLLGIKLRPSLVFQEKYDTFFPSEQYSAYVAYESGSVDDRYRTVEKRKSTTFYFNPLNGNEFDTIINAVGIEPLVQCTLYLKIKYGVSQ
jgi:uncharacterized protein YggE